MTKKVILGSLALFLVLLFLVGCESEDFTGELPPEPSAPTSGEPTGVNAPSGDLGGQAISFEPGFSSAFDVYAANPEQARLFFVEQAETDMFSFAEDKFNFPVRVEHKGGLVYKFGYYYAKSGWKKYELNPGVSGFRNTNWILEKGVTSIELDRNDFTDELNWITSYSCKKYAGKWRCGMQVKDGAGGLWMLESFKLLNLGTPTEPTDLVAVCRDTDNNQLGVRGIATGIFAEGAMRESGSATDACLSDGQLREWYCDGTNRVYRNVECPGGCIGGACRPTTCPNGALDVDEQCDGDLVAEGLSMECPANFRGSKSCSATCQITDQCRPPLVTTVDFKYGYGNLPATYTAVECVAQNGVIVCDYAHNGVEGASYLGEARAAAGYKVDKVEVVYAGVVRQTILCNAKQPCTFTTGAYTDGGDHTARLTVSSAVMLTVAKAGDGTGKVISDPAGIDCGSVCTGSFAPGSEVTLTEEVTGGSLFGDWADCQPVANAPQCRVTMGALGSAAATITATFNPAPAPVAILSVVASGGVVTSTSNPAQTDQVNCGANGPDCDATYPQAATTVVTLTAAADTGYTFGSWSSACTPVQGTATQCTVAMDAAKTVTATFNQNQATFDACIRCIVPMRNTDFVRPSGLAGVDDGNAKATCADKLVFGKSDGSGGYTAYTITATTPVYAAQVMNDGQDNEKLECLIGRTTDTQVIAKCKDIVSSNLANPYYRALSSSTACALTTN